MQINIIPELLITQGWSQSFPVRFFSKIKRTDTCWLWTGYIMSNGYGTMPKGYTKAGSRSVLAHRASWILHFGQIPEDKWVLHSCDVRNCVNPKHLWLGTHEDNMRDMKAKGRETHNIGMLAGERCHLAKLTWDLVRQIRAEYVPHRLGAPKLAIKYGVVKSVISSIVLNKTWVDAQWTPTDHSLIASAEVCTHIRRLYSEGLSQDAIAESVGLSQSTVSNIILRVRGYTHR